jgi:hypothetical protein
MRIFDKKDGGIVQLIDKEKMMDWPPELPLIFIEYIRNEKLKNYGSKAVQNEVNKYLDEVIKDVAIPLMAQGLETNETEKKIALLERIEEITRKKTDMAKPVKPYLEKLTNDKSTKVKQLAEKSLNNFAKAAKRKKLEEMRKKMQQLEKDWLADKVTDEEYASERKKLLKLQEEVNA